jgi:hypothetical protein
MCNPSAISEAVLKHPINMVTADGKSHQSQKDWQLPDKTSILLVRREGPVVYIRKQHSRPALIGTLTSQCQMLSSLGEIGAIVLFVIEIELFPSFVTRRPRSISIENPKPLIVVDRIFLEVATTRW